MTNQTNTQPPAQTPAVQSRRDQIRETMIKNKEFLKNALPKNIPVDRMIQIAMLTMTKSPQLFECTISSIMGSIMQSCQLGLLPDGVTGEAYFIPFNVSKKTRDGQWYKQYECQFMPGYRGLITLAYRSGMVKSFNAYAVYEGDKFEYSFGLNEKCVHIPADAINDDAQRLTHTYAVVKTTMGGEIFDVMTRKQIEAVRRTSKAPNSDAWVNHYSEMAIKTVIRKIAKRCPLSSEFNTAVALDEAVDVMGESQNNGMLLFPETQPVDEIPQTFDLPAEQPPVFEPQCAVKNEPTPLEKKAAAAAQQTIDAAIEKVNASRARKNKIEPNPATQQTIDGLGDGQK